MKMSELIIAIGDDNVEFQNLDHCAIDLDYTAKSGTKIRFGTHMPLTPDGTKKLGLILWLDRDLVEAAIKEKK